MTPTDKHELLRISSSILDSLTNLNNNQSNINSEALKVNFEGSRNILDLSEVIITETDKIRDNIKKILNIVSEANKLN
jgi:hypothetical protein